jgi:predicted aminopeptidase
MFGAGSAPEWIRRVHETVSEAMTTTRRARLALSLIVSAVLAACSPGYVWRAGMEEAKILDSSRPIRDAVHDTTLSSATRAKLRLVEDARDFAADAIGLDPDDTFTNYAEVSSDTLLMVVSAVEELRLAWKTWWYPIVGRVPYKGFFDFDKARQEADQLEEDGYDVWVRPSSAFSTLGWFPDPVLSTTLRSDSLRVVETVIHEITHTTYFPKGQARFNESFANFVGHRGAIEFYCDAVDDDELCQAATDRWHDVRVFGRFFNSIVDPLTELYAEPVSDELKRSRKAVILADAAEAFRTYVKPELRGGQYGDLDSERLNNAWLLSRVLYFSRLDDFEEVYDRQGSLRDAVQQLTDGSGDPWERLDEILAETVAPTAASGASRPGAR